MICEKCGHFMFREHGAENFTCECRKFIVRYEWYRKREIWAHSPEEAAQKYYEKLEFEHDIIISVTDGRETADYKVTIQKKYVATKHRPPQNTKSERKT